MMQPPPRMIPACATGHKRKPWTQLKPLPGAPRAPRSGLVCVQCSQTWEWFGDELRPTYPEKQQ
jgi:hypothetical protein